MFQHSVTNGCAAPLPQKHTAGAWLEGRGSVLVRRRAVLGSDPGSTCYFWQSQNFLVRKEEGPQLLPGMPEAWEVSSSRV